MPTSVKSRGLALLAAAALAASTAGAQAPAARQPGGYLVPPAPIPQILDTPPTPGVSVSPGRTTIALLGRENLPSLAELAVSTLSSLL